jgi:hypothetical protein
MSFDKQKTIDFRAGADYNSKANFQVQTFNLN